MLNTHECVAMVPIFQDLGAVEQHEIEKIVRHQHYPAKATIFHDGDPLDSLLIIASGQVKVYQLAVNGREQLLYLLQAGDIDGQAALFEKQTQTSFGETLTPADICSIRRSDFQDLMAKHPSISLQVLNVFGQRLSQLEAQTTRTATESVEARLANYLIETSATFDDQTFKLPLKKKDLATFLGTTPETISRKLSLFEQKGLIAQLPGKQIKVLDGDQLLWLTS